MKRTIFFFIVMAITCKLFAQNETLREWANKSEDSVTQSSYDTLLNIKSYSVSLKDGLFLCDGELSISNLNEEKLFFNTLSYLANWNDSNERYLITAQGEKLYDVQVGTAGLLKVDPVAKMLNFETGIQYRPSGNISNYDYIFKIAISIQGNNLVFSVHNIRRVIPKLFGKSYAKDFEARYQDPDNLSEQKKDELSDFNKEISIFINKMEKSISANKQIIPITHWDNIREKTICEGMSKTECLLSWGHPRKINTATGHEIATEQWTYFETYVHFTNGKISSIINL